MKVRETIREAAPEAEETINYGIPTFTLKGNFVHFSAFKNHIGFYPTPSGIENFKTELSAYEMAKGSVKFPLDQPIPYDLIARIVEFRVKENREKAQGKRKRESNNKTCLPSRKTELPKCGRPALRKSFIGNQTSIVLTDANIQLLEIDSELSLVLTHGLAQVLPGDHRK